MNRFIQSNKWGISALLLGIVLMWAGVLRKEVGIVWMKTIRICFECIGIG